MISADAAFERVANAAAAAYAAAPPFIACEVEVRTTAPTLPPFERQTFTVRTADGKALIRPDGGGPAIVGDPWPLSPSVDALAEWAFAFDPSRDHVRLDVAYERPTRYAEPTPAPGDTVVVASVGGYSVAYASDDTSHIVLEPASSAERAFAAQPDHFVYHDVWFDAFTYLPRRVTLVAPGQTFELDYTVAESHWLLQSFTYDGSLATRPAPPHLDHIEARYSGYTFPVFVPELSAEAVPHAHG